MQIREIMSEDVMTVMDDVIAEDAFHRMRVNNIHHLMVVHDNDVVGVLSERDLGGKKGFDLCQGKVVGDFVSKDIVTASPDDSIQDAATLLQGYNIGCLPVVENGKLVGIVTISDVLRLVSQGVLTSE